MRHCRQFSLLMCFAGIMCLQAQSLPLTVERRGSYLGVVVPRLHFLEGKPLEQLHNGVSVTYVFALVLTSDQRTVARSQERFVLSFDLWEEKFSAVQTGPPGRSGSHLTSAMAEAWCLENLRIPVPTLGPDKTFVLKLDCWTVGNEGESNNDTPSGLSLASLIDALSRKGRDAPPRWEAVSDLLHLADLNDKKK